MRRFRALAIVRINAAGKVDEMVVDLAGSVTFKRVPERPRPATAASSGSDPR